MRPEKGRFESADEGIPFLDEIEHLPLELQLKLFCQFPTLPRHPTLFNSYPPSRSVPGL